MIDDLLLTFGVSIVEVIVSAADRKRENVGMGKFQENFHENSGLLRKSGEVNRIDKVTKLRTTNPV